MQRGITDYFPRKKRKRYELRQTSIANYLSRKTSKKVALWHIQPDPLLLFLKKHDFFALLSCCKATQKWITQFKYWFFTMQHQWQYFSLEQKTKVRKLRYPTSSTLQYYAGFNNSIRSLWVLADKELSFTSFPALQMLNMHNLQPHQIKPICESLPCQLKSLTLHGQYGITGKHKFEVSFARLECLEKLCVSDIELHWTDLNVTLHKLKCYGCIEFTNAMKSQASQCVSLKRNTMVIFLDYKLHPLVQEFYAPQNFIQELEKFLQKNPQITSLHLNDSFNQYMSFRGTERLQKLFFGTQFLNMCHLSETVIRHITFKSSLSLIPHFTLPFTLKSLVLIDFACDIHNFADLAPCLVYLELKTFNAYDDAWKEILQEQKSISITFPETLRTLILPDFCEFTPLLCFQFPVHLKELSIYSKEEDTMLHKLAKKHCIACKVFSRSRRNY